MLWTWRVCGVPSDLGLLTCVLLKPNKGFILQKLSKFRCFMKMMFRSIAKFQKGMKTRICRGLIKSIKAIHSSSLFLSQYPPYYCLCKPSEFTLSFFSLHILAYMSFLGISFTCFLYDFLRPTNCPQLQFQIQEEIKPLALSSG